jgi:hypothetical protein
MISVTKVEALDDYILKLEFNNSEIKYFEMRNYLNHGIFKDLKDSTIFKSVKLYFDTINWSNGADICPEILYKDSKDEISFVK